MSGRRSNPKGRNAWGVDRIIIVKRSLLHSPQFSALSATSRSLLFELQAMFNGKNNGTIFLSCKDAGDRLGLSDLKAVRAAFDELRDLGFITETVGASFAIKAGRCSKARAWNLNWIVRGQCSGPDVLPALDYRHLAPAQKRRVEKRGQVLARYLRQYQQGKFAVEDCTTVEARKVFAGPSPVEDFTSTESTNGANPPIRNMEDSTHYIEYHGGVGNGWWGTDHVLRVHQMISGLFSGEPLKAAA
jgi:hypothetical protein